ncbi:odorant receptor Or2-like [Diabrotica undecimpunctata]|uniref:odorant receptor Or2-like n=1 Tax=Diabrotica undecimpunctata TaxID=50387 RepID=UPI003B6407B6
MILFCYYKIIPMSLILFLLGQITLLKHDIRHVNIENANDVCVVKKSTENKLRDCVKSHQLIIRLMNWIQHSLKEIILIQYVSYVLDTAAFMIPTLTEESLQLKLRCFAGFTMTVIQMYFFFWFANEIQEESKSIADVIYNDVIWVDASESDKKVLMTMMLRSQQKLALKSTALGEMSLICFTKIMKLCYTVCTFFTTMYDK